VGEYIFFVEYNPQFLILGDKTNLGENRGLIGPFGQFYEISGEKATIEISKILHFWLF
jgi:hypothetical protein